jgi:hypothetical protein
MNIIPVRVPEERTAVRYASTVPSGPTAPPVYISRRPQWASRSQENWPGDDGDEAAAAASTTRSYDYFAELDQKLAVLRRLGAPGGS